MLRNVKDLRGYSIRATDGAMGTVDDLYFDDEGPTDGNMIVDGLLTLSIELCLRVVRRSAFDGVASQID